jgi:hypothetical protein
MTLYKNEKKEKETRSICTGLCSVLGERGRVYGQELLRAIASPIEREVQGRTLVSIFPLQQYALHFFFPDEIPRSLALDV